MSARGILQNAPALGKILHTHSPLPFGGERIRIPGERIGREERLPVSPV
jgi:hypothetical protein